MSLADCTANLRAPIVTRVADKPTVKVHSVEWRKVQNGDPVEINPSVGGRRRVAEGRGRGNPVLLWRDCGVPGPCQPGRWRR